MSRKLTDVLPVEVKLAFYRYGHLYIVQENILSILSAKGGDFSRVKLNFEPDRFSSYSDNVALVGKEGSVQIRGTHVYNEQTERGDYAAPLAHPTLNGEFIGPKPMFPWDGQDIMGMPVEKHGKVTHSPLLERSYYAPLLGASLEPNSVLVFQRENKGFAELNGTVGQLIYASCEDLPDMLTPYVYPRQNLFGGGFLGGYVFTPDGGMSWLKRRVAGIAVLTEKSILSVSSAGVELLVGTFGGKVAK